MPAISDGNFEYLVAQLEKTNDRLDGESKLLNGLIDHRDKQGAEVNSSLRFMKWVALSLFGLALPIEGFAITGIVRFAQLESNLAIVKQNTSDLKENFKRSQTHYQTQDQRFNKAMEAIARLEQSLAQGRSNPGPK